ncbi:syndetin [Microplitis demolitor]|uniref:syndetin n=1 Tax=Microplitis demolitor TaxID=69319 RepID=UPI0004CD234F|nr:syndetin [Microplitis demolitor]XP_008543883.1 syndetin [Microplitis demolitor]
MENFRFKLLDFLNKQHQLQIPSMGLNPDLLNPLESCRHDNIQFKVSHDIENEAISDEQILETIESVYYQIDDAFDPCRHELNKISHHPSCYQIEKFNQQFNQQQYVVSKKVLQLILQKQNACNQQFHEALDIQNELQSLIKICKSGRSSLHSATVKFTIASLGILANYKRRQTIEKLMSSLNSIKTLQRTEDHLQELLTEGNFPGAISLLLECRSVAQTYKHFFCIAALSRKLQDTLEQVEETLDFNLTKICGNFDEKMYSSIQEAYQLLGKTQIAIDQLHMHFTVTIHNTAFDVVHSYVGGDIKRQFKEMCESISHENFINCLIDLSKTLWRIIHSYYQVFNWHVTCAEYTIKNDEKILKNDLGKQYVQHKLETGIIKIWMDIEIKISTFLVSTDITCFKFEQFVRILGIINRLMEASEELCGKKLEILQESMKKQCLLYFSHYHASRLDELCIFLEHDGWELCPVKSTFVATQLQEFKSLKSVLDNCELLSNTDRLHFNDHDNFRSDAGSCRKYLESDITFFDVDFDETKDEDILVNVDDKAFEYISEDSEDEVNHDVKNNSTIEKFHIKNSKRRLKSILVAPMVTNTTLNVLRVCGRYLQMSRLLSTIAVTVIRSMIQFFELYLYCINLFFTSDLQITSESLYSPKLKLTLTRIEENLINNNTTNIESEKIKLRKLNLSTVVDLQNDDKLFGLAERVVGVESLIFLGQQYNNLQAFLMQFVSDNSERGFLSQFYVQTVESAVDLRKPVYMAVVSKCFDVTNILSLMNKVNWEIRDVMSQHSNYIDILLQKIENFAKSLDEVMYIVPLSIDVRCAIWENVAHLITHTLVEGFSNAKKCSNGGRGLMQLDFTQLKSKFEMITGVRPMPHSEYVETYVKAYYIPENLLHDWIRKHKEYSNKQLTGLISCMCQNNKKSRQKFIMIIEEQSNR